jgi:hypothetical protein
MPLKQVLSNPGDECTKIFLRSRDALGNFFRNESPTDLNSYFVEIFLLSDLRMIPAIVSCITNEAKNKVVVITMIMIASIFRNP